MNEDPRKALTEKSMRKHYILKKKKIKDSNF